MASLDDSVQFLKGVGPKRLKVLDRLGINTVRNLLYFLPRDYEDRSQITPIAKLEIGKKVTIRGVVAAVRKYRSRRGKAMAEVVVDDGTGMLRCVWFSTRFFQEDHFPQDREMLFTGKVEFYHNLQMPSPQYELADTGEELFGTRILPVYPLTEDMNQTNLRRVMESAVEKYLPHVEDLFTAPYLAKRELPPLAEALRHVHFPPSTEAGARARRRLAYDEFFLLEFGMALRRRGIRKAQSGFQFEITPKIDERIRKRFPFTLTAAQEKVVAEIASDMAADVPMNRLLNHCAANIPTQANCEGGTHE